MKKVNLFLHFPKKNRLYNFSLPLSLFYILLAIGIGILGSLAFLAKTRARGVVERNRFFSLQRENRLLKKKLKELEVRVRDLDKKLSTLVLSDTKLRVVVNMRPLPPDLRKSGVGGIYRDKRAEEIARYDPEVSKRIKDMDETLEKLLAQSRFQEKSYKEIEKWLQERAYLRSRTPSIWPVRGILTSGFGYRKDPFTGQIRMHEGIDIAGPVGTPIHTTADGKVVFAGPKHGWGLVVEINHGYGYKTIYAHLHSIKVSEGDFVKRGDIIGLRGNTGRSTGPHLHYEVRVSGVPVNPVNYILNTSAVVD